MTGLLAYSGITAKIQAMESKLIQEDRLKEMASLDSVPQALEYLKRQPAYEGIFDDMEQQPHRGEIEQRLLLSKYRDFAKLYRFSQASQRHFLDLYFLHYEIAVLKRCLRCVLDHRPVDLDLSMFQSFFEKHSGLDLIRLSSAADMQEFVAGLEGSVFYRLLTQLAAGGKATLFDYELNMDLLYFRTMWKAAGSLSRKEERILTRCLGARLDMLNIQWIYRSKKYYPLPPADIYSLLIPVQHRLKKEELQKLASASGLSEFFAALKSTAYSSLSQAELEDGRNLEDLCTEALDRIYRITSRRQPYSIASLNSYLYFKEEEIQKIITVIEGIRYGLGADTICSYVIKNERRARRHD